MHIGNPINLTPLEKDNKKILELAAYHYLKKHNYNETLNAYKDETDIEKTIDLSYGIHDNMTDAEKMQKHFAKSFYMNLFANPHMDFLSDWWEPFWERVNDHMQMNNQLKSPINKYIDDIGGMGKCKLTYDSEKSA